MSKTFHVTIEGDSNHFKKLSEWLYDRKYFNNSQFCAGSISQGSSSSLHVLATLSDCRLARITLCFQDVSLAMQCKLFFG